MVRMVRPLMIVLAAATVASAAVVPAQAGETGADTEETLRRLERLLGEAGAEMARALEDLLQKVPRYAPPEMTEDGDIIIRRLDPPASPRLAPDQTEI